MVRIYREVINMGAWGIAIFSDDFACDVRDDYVSLLVNGKSEDEAYQEIIKLHYNDTKGTDDEPIFWYALALTQWKKGRLMNEVKDKALEFIESGSDLHRWNYPGNEKNYKKRIEVLEKFKTTITSPMPMKKKLRKPSWIWTSPWRKGAILCYKVIDSRCPEEFINKYILVRVIEVYQSESSGFITEELALGLYGWYGNEIPDKDITKHLDYIEISDGNNEVLGRMLIRFLRTDISKKEIKERNIVCLEQDEHFNKPDYFNVGCKNVYAPLAVLDMSFTEAIKRYFNQDGIKFK